jgi:hypothetical protein
MIDVHRIDPSIEWAVRNRDPARLLTETEDALEEKVNEGFGL